MKECTIGAWPFEIRLQGLVSNRRMRLRNNSLGVEVGIFQDTNLMLQWKEKNLSDWLAENDSPLPQAVRYTNLVSKSEQKSEQSKFPVGTRIFSRLQSQDLNNSQHLLYLPQDLLRKSRDFT